MNNQSYVAGWPQQTEEEIRDETRTKTIEEIVDMIKNLYRDASECAGYSSMMDMCEAQSLAYETVLTRLVIMTKLD